MHLLTSIINIIMIDVYRLILSILKVFVEAMLQYHDNSSCVATLSTPPVLTVQIVITFTRLEYNYIIQYWITVLLYY